MSWGLKRESAEADQGMLIREDFMEEVTLNK